MAPEFDLDMEEVTYKPPLPNNQYTLRVIKCDLQQANNPNKRTGQKEWYFACELRPLDQEFTDYTVFHNWSMTQAAMEVEDPAFSLKKMYEVMGEEPGRPNTDVVSAWTFIAETTLKENQNKRQVPNITKIIGPAQ